LSTPTKNYTLCISENVCVSKFKYHVKCSFFQIFFILFYNHSWQLLATWPITISIVNPIGLYNNRPSNYAQEAMEASLSEMQSEVQEYAREKKLQETQ
jgi:hypothetical protein